VVQKTMLRVYTFTNIIIIIVKEYYFGLLILSYNVFYINLRLFSYPVSIIMERKSFLI